MRKIPTLFVRNETTHRIEPVLNTGVEWVLAGAGRATRKVDGTAVLIREATAYKRRVVRPGPQGGEPAGFIAVQTDATTGKTVGWSPIRTNAREDRYHVEAIRRLDPAEATAGPEGRTFELVGPRVQRNTEQLAEHRLIAHDSDELRLPELDDLVTGRSAAEAWEILDRHLRTASYEGIVWHGEGGRRAKIKRRDFGYRWPPAT